MSSKTIPTDARTTGLVAIYPLLAMTQVLMFGVLLLRGVGVVRKISRLRPNQLLFGIALALLMASPLFQKEFQDGDEVWISSSFISVVAHVSNGEEQDTWTLDAFEDQPTGIVGPAKATIVPALPGARMLAPYGPVAGVIPLALCVAVVALLFRIHGA